jgi:hypothetical protein
MIHDEAVDDITQIVPIMADLFVVVIFARFKGNQTT